MIKLFADCAVANERCMSRGSFSSVLTLSKSRSRTRSRSVSSEYVKDEMNEDGIVYIYDEEGVLVNDMTVDGRNIKRF